MDLGFSGFKSAPTVPTVTVLCAQKTRWPVSSLKVFSGKFDNVPFFTTLKPFDVPVVRHLRLNNAPLEYLSMSTYCSLCPVLSCSVFYRGVWQARY
jgi:hypothetical protein